MERPSFFSPARDGADDDMNKSEHHQQQEAKEAVPRWAHHDDPPSLLARIPWLLLLPSFVVNYVRPGAAGPPRPKNPTAYLDGLRGVAALVVYLYHFSMMWRLADLEMGYGGPRSANYWYQLPVVRLLIAGRASVTVFFVISGYVLSIRTLRLLYRHQHDDHRGLPAHQQQQQQERQQQQYGKVLAALSSSVFRRPFRLYLPIAVASGVLCILVQVHFPFLADHASNGGIAFNAGSSRLQLAHWWATMSRLVNPFTIDGIRGQGISRISMYIAPLWTIPTEFKGSLAVFLMLLAFARARRAVAMAATLLVGVVWQLHKGDPDMALFMAGLLLAEMCLAFPPSALLARRPAQHLAHHAAATLLFFVALWLLSTPLIDTALTPGYRSFAHLAPRAYWGASSDLTINNSVQLFWIAVGSMLLILALMYAPPARMVAAESGSCCSGISIPKPTDEECPRWGQQQKQKEHGLLASLSRLAENIWETKPEKEHHRRHHHHHYPPQASPPPPPQEPLLQQLFTNPVAQYLGAISFSLYLVHEAVNHVIGTRYAVPGYELWHAFEIVYGSPAMGGVSFAQAELAREALPAFRRQFWSWYIFSLFVNTVVVVWVSDLFMRAVDGPSVRFARWIGRFVESSR